MQLGLFESEANEVVDEEVDGMAAEESGKVRTLDERGHPTDGLPIAAGERFRTLSGRLTTPYPSKKAERFASAWLIENAVQEAEARCDSFNVTVFQGEKPMKKSGELPPASVASMLTYLFAWQPKVPRAVLCPLTVSR